VTAIGRESVVDLGMPVVGEEVSIMRDNNWT
jgi:hypothetical protein